MSKDVADVADVVVGRGSVVHPKNHSIADSTPPVRAGLRGLAALAWTQPATTRTAQRFEEERGNRTPS